MSGSVPFLGTPSEVVTRAPVVTVFGHRMALNDPARDRFITPSLTHAGCFEPFQTEVVLNEARPGDTVLDVGAHIGYYTLLLARAVGPTGKVLAFEPDPLNFALLRRNVEMNGYANVELFNCAVSDRCGRAQLYRSTDNAGDHRLHKSPEVRNAVEVETVTMDEVFRDREVRTDFIKVDVQGSEGAVLEGMAGLLARLSRVKMIVEFWPAGMARAGYGAERLLARLTGLGFRVYEVDEVEVCVRKADFRRLLGRFPVASEQFTNLLCVKR